MDTKAKYKTKQREVLLGFLSASPGKHFTAGEICEYMKSQGEAIGQSTVYRRLEALVDEGILNKYIMDGNSPACFEYIGEDGHENEEVCFHCKCEACGTLIHLHCEELEEIGTHLLKDHQFRMDPKRTVFYGLCEKCREKTGE